MKTTDTKYRRSLMATITMAVVLFVIIVFAFWKWNTQAVVISNSSNLPANFSKDTFSHQILATLLTRFVNKNGHVNYQAWFDDKSAVEQLHHYLTAVAMFSPENDPQRFKGKNDRLGYWVYSYNAQVIRSILDNWPLSSVTDLKAPVEIVQGLGFFYNRKFIFGGKEYNLYQVENGKIFDGEGDPRVHFILNCGSKSCPVLRPQLPVGDALEPFLVQSSQDFIENEKNLSIDHKNRRLYLSTIFKWYKDDFLQAVSNNHNNPSLIDYLRSISRDSFRTTLANINDYQISFIDYDWDINQAKKRSTNE